MTENAQPVPEGYHTITPSIVVKDGVGAIEFYKKAFDASEKYRIDAPGGTVMHAELKIGDSTIMLENENPDHPGHSEYCAKSPAELNGASSTFYLYVGNSDELFKQSVEAGAEILEPMRDMFWGDRVGSVRDPFGYIWSIASRRETVSPDEIKKRSLESFARTAGAEP